MKPCASFFLVFFLVYLCSSCRNPSAPLKQESLSLAGKLYLFAPELDSVNMVATGACDACTTNILFLDDSNLIAIWYFVDGEVYSRGRYRLTDQELFLSYDSVEVSKSYMEPALRDSMMKWPTDSTYEISVLPHMQDTYKKTMYKGQPVFVRPGDFGVFDKQNVTAAEKLHSIHAEGISDRLNTDPKLIPRNFPPNKNQDLLGVWSAPGEQIEADFEIGKDSIFYTDNFRRYSYQIRQDSIEILYDSTRRVFHF